MDAYYGLVPAKNGDGTEMFLEKLLYGESHYGTNIQKSYSIRYADGGGVRISAEEYEAYAANFREVRLIAYTQDNTSVVVAAGPANN